MPTVQPAPLAWRTFLKQWGVLIAFGIAAMAFLAGFRIWTNHKLDEAIAEPYQRLIDHLAAGSPQARAHLEAYQHRFGRQTITARHYEQVCAVMLRRAIADRVDTGIVADRIGPGCGYIARGRRSDALPLR